MSQMTSVTMLMMKMYGKSSPQYAMMDEWLISPISQQNALDLLEIMEIRYNHKSTIFCSQIEIDGWLERIMGERTVAEAILDRIVNNTFVIRLEGESMRKSGMT